MEHVVGIGLAAGAGVRFRPLSLKAKGYLRAKAAVHFLGRRVLDWIIGTLRSQGITDYLMVTKGKENRYQIKNIIGYGEALGVRVRYSPVSYDRDNTGSGDAVLTNLDNFDIRDTALIFPTDSLIDLDLPAMLAQHQQTGAVVTIAAARQPAEVIAGRYGLIDQNRLGQVHGFIEKPSLEAIYDRFDAGGQAHPKLPPLMTNAGFYLINSRMLREIARHPEVVEMRKRQFDIGGDLLPWLVSHGYPVYSHEIGRMGDLGNIPCYLETMLDVLHGCFDSMNALLEEEHLQGEHIIIEAESLEMADPISGLTLAEKLEQGLVDIRPPVRIGKYVQIYPGVTLSECNIDDDCEIFEHATIARSSIGSGTVIGPFCHVEESMTGLMAELQSTRDQQIVLKQHIAIGDETVIRGGVTLSDGVTVYPRLKVPAGIRIPAHTDVESSEQLLEFPTDRYPEPLGVYSSYLDDYLGRKAATPEILEAIFRTMPRVPTEGGRVAS